MKPRSKRTTLILIAGFVLSSFVCAAAETPQRKKPAAAKKPAAPNKVAALKADAAKAAAEYKASLEKVLALQQTELEKAEVEATAGGGMVKVVVNGKNEIVSIKIDPEVVNKDDVEMLQDLVLAAVNSAREKVQEMQSEKMSALTGGLNIPGLNFPF